MRFKSAVVVGIVVGFLSAVGVARAGETSADVTVRRWPSAAAPAVRDLPAGMRVIARGHWRGWVSIAGPARGWIPVGSYSPSSGSEAKAASQEITPPPQVQALAAAPAQAAAPAASPVTASDRSEGDLMFEALNATRETPNADKIDKLVADANAEVKRNEESTRRKKVAVMALYWKDPFSDDPDRPIAVTPRKRASELVAQRRMAARARAETASARAEAAAARADAARAKAEAARAEATAAHADAMAAKRDAAVARAGCSDPGAPRVTTTLARDTSPRERPAPPPERSRVVRTPSRRAQALKVAIARALRDRRPASPADSPSAPANAPTEEPSPPLPTSFHSTDPRGIVIVPINQAPAAASPH